MDALRARIAELEAELDARDEFLSIVAHELRNPIAPVLLDIHRLIAQVRAAAGGQIPAAQLLPRLAAFEQRFERFLATLNRLLDVSRIGAGRIELARERVDFAEVVHEVADSFQREIAAARSQLALNCQAQVVGDWDRLRLEQICGNLLSNAIRYGAGTPIEIALHADAEYAVLEVRDHGIGIAEQDQARIFDRFERAKGSRRVGGLGVGLWIVRELCTALGGHVRLRSKPGQGATFTVTLPRYGG